MKTDFISLEYVQIDEHSKHYAQEVKLDKKIVQAVLERSKGLCEVCYAPGTELHHIIYGKGKRKQHETIESVVLLCYECHRGTYGVHGREGKKLDRQLKIMLQGKYKSLGYGEDDIRELMGGKIYD